MLLLYRWRGEGLERSPRLIQTSSLEEYGVGKGETWARMASSSLRGWGRHNVRVKGRKSSIKKVVCEHEKNQKGDSAETATMEWVGY